MVLLAVTAELFDHVPLGLMVKAEHSLHEAAANIPLEICERLFTAEKLSDEDRAGIIAIARQALIRFQPEAEPMNHSNSAPKKNQ